MARKIFEFCSFWDACRVYFRGQNTIKTCNIRTLPYTNLKKVAKNELNHSKTHFADFWMIKNFPGKTAVYVSCPYRVEPSCKEAKKSLEPFPSVVRVYVIENPNLFCEWCICPPFPSFPSFGIIIITYCQKCRLYIKTHKYYTNYI